MDEVRTKRRRFHARMLWGAGQDAHEESSLGATPGSQIRAGRGAPVTEQARLRKELRPTTGDLLLSLSTVRWSEYDASDLSAPQLARAADGCL